MPHLLPEDLEKIRALAHQYWLEEGRPEGRAEIHWQRALASLTAQPASAGESRQRLIAVAAKSKGVIADKSPRSKAAPAKTSKSKSPKR